MYGQAYRAELSVERCLETSVSYKEESPCLLWILLGFFVPSVRRTEKAYCLTKRKLLWSFTVRQRKAFGVLHTQARN